MLYRAGQLHNAVPVAIYSADWPYSRCLLLLLMLLAVFVITAPSVTAVIGIIIKNTSIN